MTINDLITITNDMDDNDIRMAFRKAMVQHHPDRGGDHESMIIINEAWAQYKSGIKVWAHATTTHATTYETTHNTNMYTNERGRRMAYYIRTKARLNNLMRNNTNITPGMRVLMDELATLEDELNIKM